MKKVRSLLDAAHAGAVSFRVKARCLNASAAQQLLGRSAYFLYRVMQASAKRHGEAMPSFDFSSLFLLHEVHTDYRKSETSFLVMAMQTCYWLEAESMEQFLMEWKRAYGKFTWASYTVKRFYSWLLPLLLLLLLLHHLLY